MKRVLWTVCAAGLLLGQWGCVAVSSKNNRFGNDSDVVAVNGRVYVVNKSSGDVREIDIGHAKKFEPKPAEPDSSAD